MNAAAYAGTLLSTEQIREDLKKIDEKNTHQSAKELLHKQWLENPFTKEFITGLEKSRDIKLSESMSVAEVTSEINLKLKLKEAQTLERVIKYARTNLSTSSPYGE